VHIFIGRNGTVEGAQLVDGPVQFADAALRAIDQWRFEPTMLGGTAIEVEEDVTLVFRIVSPSSSVN
jgi:outer membrane biosynthesis protein TonB